MTHSRLDDTAILAVCCLASILVGCSSPHPNRDPTGEELPPLTGMTLDGEELNLPEDLVGAAAVLLVGFEQEAQFDADRWLFGLLQSETPARVLEVPTIPGRIAGAFARFIDSGMRSGIPDEDWGTVLTLYGESARVMRTLTGSEGGRNMRVLLIDAHGEIRWFHDRGFSAGKLLELDREVRLLRGRVSGCRAGPIGVGHGRLRRRVVRGGTKRVVMRRPLARRHRKVLQLANTLEALLERRPTSDGSETRIA